ncbi:MAG: alpha amylase C-terminal domain-containing protein [Anaerolineae bacterium]
MRDWEYTPNGDVTEFEYSVNAMGNKFNNCNSGVLSDLQSVHHLDWHDAQPLRPGLRGQPRQPARPRPGRRAASWTTATAQVHRLANIFTLAYPYGHPSVMSSYYWSTNPASQDGDSLGPPSSNDGGTTWGPGLGVDTRPVYGQGQAAGDYPANCSGTYPAAVTTGDLGKWVCEHRNTAIANMVKFRQVTNGQPVTHWQAIGGAPSNHIAFGLGDKGFVAINRTGSSATTTYQTGMAAGSYCDITKYDYIPATGQCVDPVTTVRAPASAWIVVNSQRADRQPDAGRDGCLRHLRRRQPAGGDAGQLRGAGAARPCAAWPGRRSASWATAASTSTAAQSPAGPDRQLNATLIPSQSPGSPGGFAYTWTDTADLVDGATYYYWLEDLDVSGATTLHGPVSVLYQTPTAVTLSSVQAASAAAPAWPAWLALLLAGGLTGLVAWRRREA